MRPVICRIVIGLLCVQAAPAADVYQKAPPAIAKVLDVPPAPALSLSPRRDRALLLETDRYSTIADLSRPMLRLAGLRIDPQTTGPHNAPRIIGLTLQSLDGAFQRKLDLPADPHIGSVTWSPDGKLFAFAHTAHGSIELWIGDAATGDLRRVDGIALNAVLGDPIDWMADGRTLIAKLVPLKRGRPPLKPEIPAGPTIQEGLGKAAPVRTYQDLLTSAYDEDLFDFYAASQLALIDALSGQVKPIGLAAVYCLVDPSPDGRHLLICTLHRPYSYWHTLSAFPRKIQVAALDGKIEYTLADLPLADAVPIEGVPTGPRGYRWQPIAPATLIWTEALDEGNPKKKAELRDKLLSLPAPFTGQPVELIQLKHRYAGVQWTIDTRLLVTHYDRDRKWVQTLLIDSANPGAGGKIVWDLSSQDRYGDPGDPLHRRLPSGASTMWQSGDSIFLTGSGAGPEGDRPFLDRFDLKTLKSERIFQCESGVYEYVAALVDDNGTQFITHRQSPTEPPNYYLRRIDGQRTPITHHADPTPELRAITKKLVTYQRADGVKLSFTLYLPPDYKPGERRPTVIWAYPREYAGADTAGQVSGSPHRFTTITGPSHLFFLLAGYVVLDGATMPVVGPPETANNTYIQQIVSSAKAAIDKAVELGVTDPKRVGVGGHSYGAFMTANLLAHSDLFAAGIARSGAYNRTLTPFGFQSERRTLWEAPEIYAAMSPFMHADKLKTPILLIHGALDDNPGTFPVQSERLYQALRGNGGNVRYVWLPNESHGYQARQTIEHVLWEMVRWFDLHLKNQKATP